MNKTTLFQLAIIVVLVIVLVVIITAGQNNENSTTQQATSTATTTQTDIDPNAQSKLEKLRFATDANLGKEKITLGLPPWPGATVKSHVVAAILEKMGYTTETKEMDAGIVYTSLADKQIDMTVAGWLPTTHESYWNEKGEQLEIAGINVTTTWLGLGVPSFVSDDIQSISDLTGDSEFGNTVDHKITGIEPGAGIMESTEEAISQYGLENWTLQQSSAAAMLTAVQEAFSNEEPIIATVWQPHSTFAVGDLRKLKDPKGIYNDPEATKRFLEEHAPDYADADVSSDVLASVVYKGFAAEAPAADRFLENFNVPAETQSQWIYEFNVNDQDPEDIAADYIVEHQQKVKSWIPQQ